VQLVGNKYNSNAAGFDMLTYIYFGLCIVAYRKVGREIIQNNVAYCNFCVCVKCLSCLELCMSFCFSKTLLQIKTSKCITTTNITYYN
jgi:hypothetical protein